MMYEGGSPTIGMPMMSAIIQEMVIVRMVLCGTYLENEGKWWFHLKPGIQTVIFFCKLQ